MVCVSVWQNCEPYKNSLTNWDVVSDVHSAGPKQPHIRWGPGSPRGRRNFGVLPAIWPFVQFLWPLVECRCWRSRVMIRAVTCGVWAFCSTQCSLGICSFSLICMLLKFCLRIDLDRIWLRMRMDQLGFHCWWKFSHHYYKPVRPTARWMGFVVLAVWQMGLKCVSGFFVDFIAAITELTAASHLLACIMW